jgi:hypothetical protein
VLMERYDNLDPLIAPVVPSLREHPYDALAAVVACLDSELIRLTRKMTTPCEALTGS